jgi:adenylate cyclase
MAEAAVETVEGAVVFTDIVGFTEYNAIAGDEQALELMATQEEIVERALPPGARLVKELGDGLLLWFPDACAALETTLELQARFEAETAATMKPLWVRIGVHWGRQLQRRGDIHGHDVNVAARIVDIAGAGEVVASEATLTAMSRALPEVAFEELGPVVMKGVPEPIRLYRAQRALGEPVLAGAGRAAERQAALRGRAAAREDARRERSRRRNERR